jgi:hypothetical protein
MKAIETTLGVRQEFLMALQCPSDAFRRFRQ